MNDPISEKAIHEKATDYAFMQVWINKEDEESPAFHEYISVKSFIAGYASCQSDTSALKEEIERLKGDIEQWKAEYEKIWKIHESYKTMQDKELTAYREALSQIEQWSDSGSYEYSIVSMKRTATEALKPKESVSWDDYDWH